MADVLREAHYLCRAGLLLPGDQFATSGGPYYRNHNGARTSMAARGPFTFRAFCQNGARQWLEAVGKEGLCILYIGSEEESPVVAGLMRRPYRVTRIIGEKTMKKSEVHIGKVYTARVTDRLVPVRIDRENRHGGWDATNLATNKKVRIKSAQRLRARATPEQLKAVAQAGRCSPSVADEENARDERATAPDGMTASERAMACSAEQAKANSDATQPPDQTEQKASGTPEEKAKKTSGVDAAARVLAEASEPMSVKDIVRVAFEKGYWTSSGKTPSATVYSAIIREIASKGAKSRFKKAGRGKFTVNG